MAKQPYPSQGERHCKLHLTATLLGRDRNSKTGVEQNGTPLVFIQDVSMTPAAIAVTPNQNRIDQQSLGSLRLSATATLQVFFSNPTASASLSKRNRD